MSAVLLQVWGVTAADAERAIRRAACGPGRAGWRFAPVERLTDPECPIDPLDPAALATDRGDRWAYAVYPAGIGEGGEDGA